MKKPSTDMFLVCRLLPVFSVVVPLFLIMLAIALSGWFNIYDNALSDLGHAVRSNVVPLFNLGLSLGGFLICYV